MNKIKLLSSAIVLISSTVSLSAQSFKDIVSSSTVTDVVTSVTGGLTVTDSNIIGTWSYSQPAVELSSNSTLTDVAGSLATSQLEEKLATYCAKIGIVPGKFAFVFNSDGTFTSNVDTKSLGGTYSVDATTGNIALSYKAFNAINIGTLTASTTLTTNSLSLVFPADALLKLLSAVASKTAKSESSTFTSIINKYDGINLGFTLSGKPAITTSATTDVEKTVNTIGSFFK